MEQSAGQWKPEAAPLEPVRIDIPWDAPRPATKSTDKLAVLAGIVVASFAFAWAMSQGESSGWDDFFLTAALSATIMLVALFLLRAFLRSRNEIHRHVVTLEGSTLTVKRIRAGEATTEAFPLLEVHDLRVLPRMELLGESVVRGVGFDRSPQVWDWPERLAFTYRGRAYSFGGGVADELAESALEAIRDYDAHLRTSLGMPAEPNVLTYDPHRAAAAASDGYDVDKSPFVL